MHDAVIIGSGPAGYECARIVSELGGKAAIIEKDKLGGTCTNHGCIPTKTLHASATLFSELKKASKFGFIIPNVSVDFKAFMERKNKVVRLISAGIKKIMDDNKVEIIKGFAKIKDKNTVVVGDKEIKAKNIVIAAGASPRSLNGIPNNKFVLNSSQILELKEMPSSLIIIGGGYIGCEFALIFASLGVKVTIIEMLKRIASVEDKDVSSLLTTLMQRQNIDIFTEAKIINLEGNKIKFEQNKKEKSIQADNILVSIGMDPNIDKAELDKLGIKYSKGIDINKKMQTSVPNIYAIGDVTCKIMLAHYAYAQAVIAAKNIMGQNAEFNDSTVPSAIFTIPEISSVGERNENLKSVTFPFAANGKARAMDEADGFVKIYYEDGYLKGFCAIGPHASDLVSEATLAIKNRIKLEDIKDTIHTHPTLSEAFSGAVEMALKD
ncbi:dihydrolipoyl dehydrogenase [Candidatus Woesearchaeota archaeon]|jgi:dihydrolipoamide dehydrogenase|nr:dihydrolipoyl dehydrogenase [Candidatus Woesearchaeota archaeon]|tara:strand:- start:3146 stop:4456 length:1311 start_codon:yes stop_codon:yes gene_type:complete